VIRRLNVGRRSLNTALQKLSHFQALLETGGEILQQVSKQHVSIVLRHTAPPDEASMAVMSAIDVFTGIFHDE
jgi:exonuclease VII small subunit